MDSIENGLAELFLQFYIFIYYSLSPKSCADRFLSLSQQRKKSIKLITGPLKVKVCCKMSLTPLA